MENCLRENFVALEVVHFCHFSFKLYCLDLGLIHATCNCKKGYENSLWAHKEMKMYKKPYKSKIVLKLSFAIPCVSCGSGYRKSSWKEAQWQLACCYKKDTHFGSGCEVFQQCLEELEQILEINILTGLTNATDSESRIIKRWLKKLLSVY